jgi:2,4-dienoyl-CoA reductase-like NADH-dependent reductase (Old Yellow Enzyme family)
VAQEFIYFLVHSHKPGKAFTSAECLELVGWLNRSTLDLLELSGGSLEQPKVVGVADEGVDGRRPSTIKREAYFVEFAGAVRAVATMPVMVTGGFRTTAGMIAALEGGELSRGIPIRRAAV